MVNKGRFDIKERKMYMSKDDELRVEMIWLYYDVLVAEYNER